ncbi:GNAT family N-acetyltransferase [Mesorhizobium sp. CA8]|uniref:GNAT family N-acetyltransferase n=1 Tax=unclassified Mesorhizobium TaxID=325217 RepID=UPI001CCEFB59|nr:MULTISPECIES: GNAT family N-acetyltransferase [unclassified Mesorhizobium]MBZ9764802.1 GNAT family N-acetyltransferase [Mesorhizobium sp. CA8]MBZ9822762.1 GNAT family N-acetyltransferase [Mesorhizobium sp. CA4]
MASYPVFLNDQRTGKPVAAELLDRIDELHLRAVETDWIPQIINHIRQLIDQGQPRQTWPQSWHWNWRDKVDRINGLLAFQTFAIMCEGQLQGLMQMNSARSLCRLPEQAGKHLAYVDYVETAPWNRPNIASKPRYRGVGITMIRAAIEHSRDLGFHGRIGLHSLPQSETFYANCGMTDLGIDGTYENLRYFEMTSSQADALSG